jgi:hypothetical protein
MVLIHQLLQFPLEALIFQLGGPVTLKPSRRSLLPSPVHRELTLVQIYAHIHSHLSTSSSYLAKAESLNGGFVPFSYSTSQVSERFGYGCPFSSTVSWTMEHDRQ